MDRDLAGVIAHLAFLHCVFQHGVDSYNFFDFFVDRITISIDSGVGTISDFLLNGLHLSRKIYFYILFTSHFRNVMVYLPIPNHVCELVHGYGFWFGLKNVLDMSKKLNILSINLLRDVLNYV